MTSSHCRKPAMQLRRGMSKGLQSATLETRWARSTLIGLLLSIPPIAHAQGGAGHEPRASDTAAKGTLDEIVVTAQRREQNLAETPVAVAVVGADALRNQALISEEDLRSAMPGLNVKASFNSNDLNYVIRGQSVDTMSNTRPGVLPYINEVQISSAGGATTLYDLQSVQTLKGPQGTLFGRSATGGAVLFTTQEPTDDFGGYVTAGGGNYGQQKYEGAINVPLVADKLLARLAAVYQERDGFQDNTITGDDVGGYERKGFRLSVTGRIGDAFENQLMADYAKITGENVQAVLSSLMPGGVPFHLLYAGPANGAISDAVWSALASAAAGVPVDLTGAWQAFTAQAPYVDPNGVGSFLETQNRRGPFKVSADGANEYDVENKLLTNITTYDLSDSLQLKNIFGYFRNDSENITDSDGSPYPGLVTNFLYDRKSYTDEAQILGKTFNDKLTYVAGAYYSDEKFDFNSVSPLLALPPIIPANVQINHAILKNETIAAYAQGTYDLSEATGVEGLGVTLGVRRTREKAEVEVQPDDIRYAGAAAGTAGLALEQEHTGNNTSWTVGLQYQVNPDLLLYTVSRRSYKNAGFNAAVGAITGSGSEGGSLYEQEALTDVELGTKFNGQLGSVPTSMNLALYHNWVKDQQRVAYPVIGGVPAAISVNVPKSKVYGAELDSQISPTNWLKLGLVYNYTRGKFTDNLVSVLGVPTEFSTYPDAPKHSGLLFAQTTWPISGDIDLSVRAEWYAQSSFWIGNTGDINPDTKASKYDITNLSVQLGQDVGWSISANLKNVFDKTYIVGGVPLAPLLSFNTVVPGAPRTVLVEARYRF